MSDAAPLEARDVWVEYRDAQGATPVLTGADFTLAHGEFAGVLGPSGSGKSTLLLVLAGLRPPGRGRVTLLGEPWPQRAAAASARRRRLVGFVFQEPYLVHHLTVRENTRVQALDRDAEARIAPLAERLGIAAQLDRFPHELSGGQRQRASILRALVNRPAVALADEPTAWLDRETGREVIALLAREAATSALVVCTHDRAMLAAADRVLVLQDGGLHEMRASGERGRDARP